MTIAFVGATRDNAGSATNTSTINLPAGTVDGNWLALGVLLDVDSVLTPPSGFLQRKYVTLDASAAFYIFTKVAAGEPAVLTYTTSVVTEIWGALAAYSGAGLTYDVDSAQYNGSTDQCTVAGITTTQPDDMVVFMGFVKTPAGFANPTGFGRRLIYAGKAGRAIGVWDKSFAAAGATGDVTSPLSVATFNGAALMSVYEVGGGSGPPLPPLDPFFRFNF